MWKKNVSKGKENKNTHTNDEITNRPGARVLIEPSGAWEDHEADLSVAEYGELLGLFEDPVPPLGEGHLPAGRVVDPADHDLSPPHLLLPHTQTKNGPTD